MKINATIKLGIFCFKIQNNKENTTQGPTLSFFVCNK